MSDYLINFTDPTKLPFVVKPWTANGPISPSGLPLLPGAIAANTSLAIVGKGRFEYGENVQENMVRMLEHFAYSSSPSYPVEGQAWYKNTTGEMFFYDGIDWNATIVSGKNTTNIDLNGVVLQNIGTAINVTDALNRASANVYYLQLAGGTMTGTLVLAADPVNNLEAATKQYVDTAISTNGLYVLKTGDSMSGPLTVNSILTVQSGQIILSSTTFDGGGAVLFNITDDADPTSAVTRAYADYIASHSGDGNIVSLTYDNSLDKLVATRTAAAPLYSSNIIGDTVIDNNPDYVESQLRDDSFPTVINIPQAISILDIHTRRNSHRVRRHVVDGAYGAGSTITLPFFYQVQTDRLCINKATTMSFSKLFRNDRAEAVVDFAPYSNRGSIATILPSLYQYNINVDGTPHADMFVDMTIHPNNRVEDIFQALKDSLDQHGYQTISFAPLASPTLPKTASDVTGYGALTYGCDFTIDGGTPFTLTFDGVVDNITTLGDLITFLNANLEGSEAFIYDGKILIRSFTTGTTSSVLIDDSLHTNKIFTDLADFSAIDSAVAGFSLAGVSGENSVQYSGFVFDDGGSDSTSYGASAYAASIQIDGVRTFLISVEDGSTELPYVSDLVSLLNDTMIGFASATIEGDSIVIRSTSKGAASTVVITDDTTPANRLFENLIAGVGSPTILGVVQTPVDGTNGVVVHMDYDSIIFMSPTTGTGSEITLAAPTTGIDIFSAPINSAMSITSQVIGATGDRDYYEIGEPLTYSNQVYMIDAGPSDTTLEFLLYPGGQLL